MSDIKGKNIEIIKHPAEVLRRSGHDVKDINSENIQQLIADMIFSMKTADGIGLAAPQVNQSLNLLIVDDGSGPEAFINPRLIYKSRRQVIMEEGCLSIPKVYGTVKRAEYVWVIYKDKNGHLRFKKVTGLKARILQHEVDHLHGILFIDKAEKITQGREYLLEYESKI